MNRNTLVWFTAPPPKQRDPNTRIDHLLISAEDIAAKWFGQRLDLREEFTEVGVGEDWQKRPKDFIQCFGKATKDEQEAGPKAHEPFRRFLD